MILEKGGKFSMNAQERQRMLVSFSVYVYLHFKATPLYDFLRSYTWNPGGPHCF